VINKEENMSSPLKPLGDRVVAQVEEASNKTASGLYLPDNAKEKPKVAKVTAVGSAVRDVKVGDRIVYKEYSTTEVKVEKEDYIILKEEDVLATLA
jgi:chaperonin GroES